MREKFELIRCIIYGPIMFNSAEIYQTKSGDIALSMVSYMSEIDMYETGNLKSEPENRRATDREVRTYRSLAGE